MSKETRKALARLSFAEKLRLLEKLRARSREIGNFGLRKKPASIHRRGKDPLIET